MASVERLLTVSMVEGLHSVAVQGDAVRVLNFVSNLEDATLPGIVEYQCLRHSMENTLSLPELPTAVTSSATGLALQAVVCPFGLRKSGRSQPNNDVNPRTVEFFALRTAEEYKGHEYRLFETRWARC